MREACSDATVGGCLEPPIKLRNVLPQYPPSKRDAGVDARVQLEGRIGTDGFVKGLRLTAPAEGDFAGAAMGAVSAWRFEPTRLGGVPVETPIEDRDQLRRTIAVTHWSQRSGSSGRSAGRHLCGLEELEHVQPIHGQSLPAPASASRHANLNVHGLGVAAKTEVRTKVALGQVAPP